MNRRSERLAPVSQGGQENVTNSQLTDRCTVVDVAGPVSVKKEPTKIPIADLQYKAVAEELSFLRKTMRDLVGAYSDQVEAEIAALSTGVKADAEGKKVVPASRAHDLRDMLSLLRSLEVKPAKGRRRDLKKIEVLVEELQRILERWA
jgi:hypothetical protein